MIHIIGPRYVSIFISIMDKKLLVIENEITKYLKIKIDMIFYSQIG